jgi:hypothetical protein
MTLAQAVTLWPKIQAVFAGSGVQISLSQALSIYPAIAALVNGSTPAPAPAAPVVPDVLELGADANNAPYGVTLAGFSPQDHQGADLRDARNAKYLVYAYLVANKIAPTSTWARDAVPVLALVLPSVPWTAADTETLVYGDEYVHTAPNGLGMLPGTFNPAVNATEFLWGSFGG